MYNETKSLIKFGKISAQFAIKFCFGYVYTVQKNVTHRLQEKLYYFGSIYECVKS